ncbi:hypothetical protein GCM10009780_38190 [Actinomadura alba]
MQKRDVVPAQAVVEESGEFLPVVDLEALLVRSVDDPQCHVVPTLSSRTGATGCHALTPECHGTRLQLLLQVSAAPPSAYVRGENAWHTRSVV